MTSKGFAEMSLHQGKFDDASLLECHRCDALVIIGCDNKLWFILDLSSQALAETKCKTNLERIVRINTLSTF